MRAFVLLTLSFAAIGCRASAPANDAQPTASALQPGRWEMTSRVTSVDASGMAETELAALRRQVFSDPVHTDTRCLTAAEAANPIDDMLRRTHSPACQFGESGFSAGAIRNRMSCHLAGRPAEAVEVGGRFTAGSIDATITSTETRAEASGTQVVRASVALTWRRVGDCVAGP